MRDDEPFSNPIAPAGHQSQPDDGTDDSKPLSNDDFRKLVMSTRGGPSVHSGSKTGGGGGGATERKSGGGVLGMGHSVRGMRMGSSSGAASSEKVDAPGSVRTEKHDRDAIERRKKKKAQYLQLKKVEMDKEAELAAKYRDRAKERREVSEKEDGQEDLSSTTTQNYRAVAPGAKEGESEERRSRIIQESKFLGGDMEHTHLVKGLDYALLQKVKAEISNKEQIIEDEELDNIIENIPASSSAAATETKEKQNTPQLQQQPEDSKSKHEIKSTFAKNIHRVLFDNKLPERNELFAPGRMAYVVDLEDEFGESDVPTTVIRSKTDCPDLEATATLSANDIVIQKLTQILSYLRQGHRGKKLKKKLLAKDEGGKVADPAADDGIFGTSEFAMPQPPSTSKGGKVEKNDKGAKDGKEKLGSRWDDKEKKKLDDKDESGIFSYFDKPSKDEQDDEDDKAPPPKNAAELIKNINAKYSEHEKPEEPEEKAKKLLKKQSTDCYAECYPGMDDDHNYDSDEEADYTKMDQGNKKGPVGRWDFDTQEEYGDYMSSREALPKAAFQFGVKMADGRKTRRVKGGQNEKQKLDREWQQISKLIDKRKEGGGGGGDRKRPKY